MSNMSASIIVTVDKDFDHFKELLHGIRTQLYQNYEVIFVILDSCPATINLVKEFTQNLPKSCTRCEQEIVHGVSNSQMKNLGVDKSTGDLIFFLENNAVWYPTHIANLVTAHEKFPNCNAYFDCYNEIADDVMGYRIFKIDTDPNLYNTCNYFTLYWRMKYHLPKLSFMAFPAAVVKRERFLENANVFSEVDLICRTAIHSCMGYANIINGNYYSEPNAAEKSSPKIPAKIPAEYWLWGNWKDNPMVHFYTFEMLIKTIRYNFEAGFKDVAKEQIKRCPPLPTHYSGLRNRLRFTLLKLHISRKFPLISDDYRTAVDDCLIDMSEVL